MGIYVKKQDNLTFSFAEVEGKYLLYIDEKEHVELPPILAEALFFHINRGTQTYKCEFDGREPQDTLVTQEESEKVFQQQEAAIEELKASLEAANQKVVNFEGTQDALATANAELFKLRALLDSKKAAETPILESAPEPS